VQKNKIGGIVHMKKFTTIVLIVVIALSLFACGGGASTPLN